MRVIIKHKLNLNQQIQTGGMNMSEKYTIFLLFNYYCKGNDFCRVWTAAPGHPIAQGIPESFELEEEEMYGEPFDIPRPDDNIFISWYSGGELFRSGCTWTRGYGRIFYFQPGHETSPNYHNPYVQRIIRQGIRWAAPRTWRENFDCPNILDAPEARRKRGEQADGQPTL